MTTEDLFSQNTQTARSNVPDMSVSDLAFALKRTLEESFGHIRVRGELTGLKLAASGHLYGDIKDMDANINIVCWRSTLSRLSIRPEDGMDVIITGKVSSYPKSSRYQIIVESIDLAGEGALLKMLEERKKKLAAEGLFDAARKKPLPFLPDIIGVVTSPSGAVIRDIMHRLDDRFPRHVILWPALVQGAGAAEQVAAGIRGLNALTTNKPDLIIVARGGGSLEDLMAFNEEIVVRAVADSAIPVISAVGHETDVTLIDYVADARAPTPTGAAEMAVPVRLNLMAQTADDGERLLRGVTRRLHDGTQKLATLTAKLGRPDHLLDTKTQHLDHLSNRMVRFFERGLSQHHQRLAQLSGRLPHPRSRLSTMQERLSYVGQALARQQNKIMPPHAEKLEKLSRLLESYSFERVLDRGYVVVRGADGKIVTDGDVLDKNADISLQFKNDKRRGARITD